MAFPINTLEQNCQGFFWHHSFAASGGQTNDKGAHATASFARPRQWKTRPTAVRPRPQKGNVP